jgi:hypothetical protein
MYPYQLFNLVIHSDLAFPDHPVFEGSDPPHVTCSFGKVSPAGIEQPLLTGLYYQATRQTFWLNVPGMARFLINDGTHITIDTATKTDEATLHALVADACLSALLIQRNIFLLRGGIVAGKNGAIAFLCAPGMGLSTLMGAFLKRGYRLLSDKFCAIDTTGYALPSAPYIELRDHTAKPLGYTDLPIIREGVNKYRLPMKHQYEKQPLPLQGIYLLSMHTSPQLVSQALDGVKKIEALQQYLYSQPRLRPLADGQTYFQQSLMLANQFEMISLLRPAVEYPLDQLVYSIEQDWQARGFQP